MPLLLLTHHQTDIHNLITQNAWKDFPEDSYHLRNERFLHVVTDFEVKYHRIVHAIFTILLTADKIISIQMKVKR